MRIVTSTERCPRQYLIAGSICFFSFLLFYGVTSRGKLQASDEASVFATGVSLATRGNLAIDDLRWLQKNSVLGAEAPDGHLYTKYFPGNVLAVALVYKLTARPDDQPYVWVHEVAPSITGARWAMRVDAFWGALGMTALLLGLRAYFDWRTAILTVASIGLCSDWWYQSRGLYSEIGAGSFVIASLCFAVSGKPYGSSGAVACSILFRPTTLLALPFWGKTVWGKNFKDLASAGIIVAAVAGLGIFNWLRFGSPLNFGYGGVDRFEFSGWSILQGLVGLLLSPGRSIFVYSPILLLALPGAFLFMKKETVLTTACLVMVISYTLALSCWRGWHGGLAWGARSLLPIVPVLGFLAAPVLDYVWRNKWLASVSVLLAIAGFGIQVLALLRDPTHVLLDNVASGKVEFVDTMYSVRSSWLALQIGMLQHWQPCDLDSDTLRHLFTNCPD